MSSSPANRIDPLRDGHQPHDRLAQGGLAHAVAADHRQHTLIEGQVDALQRVGVAVIDVEAGDLENRCGGAAGGRTQAWPPPR